MKIEVESERSNPLLNRKEVKFRVVFNGGTPNIKDVRKDLIGALKSKEELTVIDAMQPTFGKSVLMGYAKVYGDEKALKIEPKHKIDKNFGKKEEEKKEAAQAAPAAPAAPTEKKGAEKKEEK